MHRISLIVLILSGILSSCSNTEALENETQTPPTNAGTTERPNILLIIADDLGYSDLGCFGGEIETPNIDALASSGLLFTQFHSGSMCAPARAMLFSGQDHHLAGWGRQSTSAGSFYEGKWGYENEFSDRVLSFPRLLQEAGYFTCIAGKWHIGKTARSNADRQGFDQSWVMLDGAASHWSSVGLGLGGYEKEVAEYTENGTAVDWPRDTFSTTFYTDKIIEFIRDKRAEPNQPFFAVAAYTSPHWPLTPPPAYRDKYRGKYDEGYDALRAQRFRNLQSRNIIPQDWELPPGLPQIRPWEQLTEEEKKREARKMELYAGMLDHLDDDIGRLLTTLKTMQLAENTITIFLSDNGADYLDFYNHPKLGKFLRSVYDNSYENMGMPGSFVSYGAPWAQTAMAPYSWFKGHVAEGGTLAPLIINGPGISARSAPVTNYCNIRDLAPTILKLARVPYQTEYQGQVYPPLSGTSLSALWQSDATKLHDPRQIICTDFQGEAFARMDHWKLMNQEDPLDPKAFKLFDLAQDPGEKTDLSVQYPALRDSLLQAVLLYQNQMKVVYE